MTPEQSRALRPGDRVTVQLRLDHEVTGVVLDVSPNGVYIDWDDTFPTFEPRSKLLRSNWSAEAGAEPHA